ncbi:MAG: DUF262 domain-containing protein [Chitinophagales bacterium]
METEIKKFTYKEICQLRYDNFLRVNPEYQRGAVWARRQEQMLIDSILRNYPIPLIYLHYREMTSGNLKNSFYDIIDGQQRINAISNFINGEFKLLDPKNPKMKNFFPDYIQQKKTPWANCTFQTLPSDYQAYFEKKQIDIVLLKTEESNEVRDLFIRLQDGIPLNAQEKRDAWPGGFSNLILKLGGKKDTKFSGHEFIQEYFQSPRIEKGNRRKLCAQLAMLFFENRSNGNFIDLNSKSIDNYYHKNLGLDLESEKCKEFEEILDYLYRLFDGYKGPKLKGFEMIDVLLLVKDLKENYTDSWNENFQYAFDSFREDLAYARKEKDGNYWYKYSVHTSTSSDQSETIRKRHLFFVNKMISKLKPVLKDDVRIYTEIDRQIIYYKYGQKCLRCLESLAWNDMEIHHVKPYADGGQTSIENGAPVHKNCHPKSIRETKEFEEEFERQKANGVYDELANNSNRKAKSPSAQEYAAKVPELSLYSTPNMTWKSLCNRLGIDVGKDSARRRFENWVKVNKPYWPEVGT